MLKPNKYTNCEINVITVAADIICVLQGCGSMKYANVVKGVENKRGNDSKYEFQNALNFLFLLGKLRYSSEEDVLELIK